MLIEPEHQKISTARQCELLGLSRSSLYYKTRPENQYNELLMRLLDQQYMRTPFYGVERMTAWLRRQGHSVNPKRVRRLMRKIGVEAIYPKKRLSASNVQHKRYPSTVVGHQSSVISRQSTVVSLAARSRV